MNPLTDHRLLINRRHFFGGVGLAALLIVAALITAVVWALMAERNRTVSRAVTTRTDHSELRIYGGLPNAASYGHPVIVLTNIGYLSGYCEARRNPAWVCFSISSITVGSTAKRLTKFITDPRTTSRVAHQDYTGSGYDRGHMAPNYAIGTRYGHEAQRETFYLSNIVPQSPNLNRIWWRLLEEREANDFAMRLERVWVMTGPVFAGDVKKLPSGVDIPASCYRIILDEENGQPRVLAFITPQTVTGHEPLAQFLTSVREIEKRTGLDFHPDLPKDVQDRMEAVKVERFGELAHAKRCDGHALHRDARRSRYVGAHEAFPAKWGRFVGPLQPHDARGEVFVAEATGSAERVSEEQVLAETCGPS